MIRSVLVPLDGSDFAEQALPLAATIARACRAKVRLVTVHEPPPPSLAADSARVYAAVDLELRRGERAYLAEQAKRLRAEGLTAVTFVLEDPVAEAIAEHARTTGVGLVVMTTHGRGLLSRFWVGSVADELIRTLAVPVLLVRPREGAQLPLPAPNERILVPLDGSPLGEAAIAPAAELAEPIGMTMALVHVIQPQAAVGDKPMFVPFAPGDEIVESEREAGERYLAGVAEALRARGLRVETAVIVHRPVAEVILELARSDDVAMVALSTRGRGGLQRLLLGSVTDKVVRAGERPVLVVRPTGRGGFPRPRASAPARARRRAGAR
jgi:nucleotide-binding universal stress UspA family protein